VVIGISCSYVLVKQLPIISSLLLSFLCVPADDGVEPPSRWWEIDDDERGSLRGSFLVVLLLRARTEDEDMKAAGKA